MGDGVICVTDQRMRGSRAHAAANVVLRPGGQRLWWSLGDVRRASPARCRGRDAQGAAAAAELAGQVAAWAPRRARAITALSPQHLECRRDLRRRRGGVRPVHGPLLAAARAAAGRPGGRAGGAARARRGLRSRRADRGARRRGSAPAASWPPTRPSRSSRPPGTPSRRRRRAGGGGGLPFDDDGFDVALAQLVVHFMSDPVAGLAEMRRVTRAGRDRRGVRVGPRAAAGPAVAVLARGRASSTPTHPTSPISRARGRGSSPPCSAKPGSYDVEDDALWVHAEHATFEEWWEPYTLGVGPAGVYVAGLDAAPAPSCASAAVCSWATGRRS